MLRQIYAILKKDMTIELRAKDILYTTILFAILLIVIFSFAFLSDPSKGREFGGGIIWVSILFASSICEIRLFDREKENSCFFGLLLTPANPKGIFFAKVLVHLILILMMEMVTVTLILVFFDLTIRNFCVFVTSLLLGTLAQSLIGTLFAAMLLNIKMKEVLLPLITYPILSPILIAGVKVVSIELGGLIEDESSQWLCFMLGFVMIFGAVTPWLFERMIRA